jgi:SAM-dependent methyltransferase
VTETLLSLLRDPVTGEELTVEEPVTGADGRIEAGRLVGRSGVAYPIRNGVPRFVDLSPDRIREVSSFGDEWNRFNFVQFRAQWLAHTVANTFGTADVFRDKIVVDAGAGSGAQAIWMLQSGARHVLLLELSHAVDGIIPANLRQSGFTNWDVIQCSIDAPPLGARSIDLVMCHNVIQHTPSVERTAKVLFELVAPGGELVFNCYPKNDQGLLRWLRLHVLYEPLRAVLSRCPYPVNLAYATVMAALRLAPGLGTALEKAGFCSQGEVVTADGSAPSLARRFAATRLNTFDRFGSHTHQHLKRDDEIRALVDDLQPDPSRVLNMDRYFSRPVPIGCALRIRR